MKPLLVSLLAILAAPRGSADEIGPPPEIAIFPRIVHLESARDRQGVVVQRILPDGATADVTAASTLTVLDPGIARLDGATLVPVADGSTTLAIDYEGRRVEVPVTVTGAGLTPPATFRNDALPVLTKGGCNQGTCHGSSRGKDGFRLSLFGFDPAGDYQRLTRELPGRRLNLENPEASLVLEKATGEVRHTGGKRFDRSSPLYRTLLEWIAGGAPPDAQDIPLLAGIEIAPLSATLVGPDATQQLLVLARYADGTDRDVTSLAAFYSNNESSASVEPEGIVRARSRGEAAVLARYGEFSVAAQILVVPDDPRFDLGEFPETNTIDTLVAKKFRKLRLVPSPLSDDATFLRRVHLDIAGRLPTEIEFSNFLADPDPAKRERVVDGLVASKEFAELWVMKWAERLRIRSSEAVSPKAMLLFHEWLETRIAANTPMDEVVRDLLAARGGTFEDPATNFYVAEPDPLKLAEDVAQIFLGIRVQCAQCHNHPFDRWTQNDYYGFAAFFSQIGRKRAEDPRETILFPSGAGETRHPVTGQNVPPKFLGGAVPDVAGKDRRGILADWIVSPENPWFARSLANFVWAHFFGVGIVEEPDDFRVSNPPSNPELLAELARRFAESRYDLRRLVRDICTSRTYQLATVPNETNAADLRNFSRAGVRRIRAEVLRDAISQVTETKDKFAGLPLGARAVQIADGAQSDHFLTTFGRSGRATVCTCEVKMTPNLSQALHLMNGDTIHRKIQEGGLVARRLAEAKLPLEIVRELYVRCLTRLPTEAELATLDGEIRAEPSDPRTVLEDIFWSLMNSREFLFNH